MSLVEIKPATDTSRRVRVEIAQALRIVREEHGHRLRGFALVAWDHRDAVVSAHSTDNGPISQGMLPVFVQDALNRHIAVSMSHTTEPEELGE